MTPEILRLLDSLDSGIADFLFGVIMLLFFAGILTIVLFVGLAVRFLYAVFIWRRIANTSWITSAEIKALRQRF